MSARGSFMSDRERRRKEGLARLFDQVASTYDHVGPRFFSHFGRRLVEVTQIPTGAVVLDVATGRGAILFPAAEQVGPQGHAVGIDLSARMVRETVAEIKSCGLKNIEVFQMDAEYLTFPGASFDVVLCGLSLFFFPLSEPPGLQANRWYSHATETCAICFGD
jgi:ubiquinone/menaquinone biosynthesis C-methylase UbiE